jgi:hypothetical protein
MINERNMQISNEERLDALMKVKSFQALTEDERSFVIQELGSEKHYTAMRKVSLALITSRAELSPDPSTIAALQSRMADQQQERAAVTIWSWKMPAYATALIVVLTSTISWWIGSSQQKQGTQIVETVHRDTVFLASKPDTLYRERIVYRTIIKHKEEKERIQLAKTVESFQAKEVGINMKEKQDLELLLVSGSR